MYDFHGDTRNIDPVDIFSFLAENVPGSQVDIVEFPCAGGSDHEHRAITALVGTTVLIGKDDGQVIMEGHDTRAEAEERYTLACRFARDAVDTARRMREAVRSGEGNPLAILLQGMSDGLAGLSGARPHPMDVLAELDMLDRVNGPADIAGWGMAPGH